MRGLLWANVYERIYGKPLSVKIYGLNYGTPIQIIVYGMI